MLLWEAFKLCVVVGGAGVVELEGRLMALHSPDLVMTLINWSPAGVEWVWAGLGC